MKVTKVIGTLGATSGLLLAACSSSPRPSVSSAENPTTPSATAMEDGEVDIELAEVPAIVKQAALSAVSGLVLTGAERETENGVVIYALEGTANGKKYEVEVSSTGQVIETESGDDDGDDDDDDDDDDDGRQR